MEKFFFERTSSMTFYSFSYAFKVTIILTSHLINCFEILFSTDKFNPKYLKKSYLIYLKRNINKTNATTDYS